MNPKSIANIVVFLIVTFLIPTLSWFVSIGMSMIITIGIITTWMLIVEPIIEHFWKNYNK